MENNDLISGELKILRDYNGAPTGIRDRTGLLLDLHTATRYTGQDERYKLEVAQQEALAMFLLRALESLTKPVEGEAGEVVDDLRGDANAAEAMAHLWFEMPNKLAHKIAELIEKQGRDLKVWEAWAENCDATEERPVFKRNQMEKT